MEGSAPSILLIDLQASRIYHGRTMADPGVLVGRTISLCHVIEKLGAGNHTNICTTHDIGEDNGQQFVAMEYLEGHTPKHRSSGKPRRLSEMLEIGRKSSDVLKRVHRRNKTGRSCLSDYPSFNLLDTGRGNTNFGQILSKRSGPLRYCDTVSFVSAENSGSYRAGLSAIGSSANASAPRLIFKNSLRAILTTVL